MNIETRKAFVAAALETYGTDVLSRTQINNLAKAEGFKDPAWLKSDKYRVARGKYQLPVDNVATESKETNVVPMKEKPVAKIVKDNLVPEKDPNFVKFGFVDDLKTIVKSKAFYPVFVTGLSGNGKTHGAQQVCAQLKRECITVPITIETDESDLLGDKTLIDGNVEFVDGPVVRAMERGAVLILDEIDLASNKIMCLQSVIDGKGVYLKKANRFVEAKKGFTIIATANTKGKGSDDGRFIGTNILNEAFLERFKVTFEQEYPTAAVEKKIINNVLESLGAPDEEYVDNLTTWSQTIRKTFEDGGVDEIISTRRLVHIAETYSIFKDRVKSVELCTNRFDDDVKTSFVDLFKKISDEVIEPKEGEYLPETDNVSDYATGDDLPF
jgi:MoxR-like ATPase